LKNLYYTGVTDPIVYVGVVEKGWAIVEVSVEGVQGHASKPPRESAIGILARAVANLVSFPVVFE
jgi:carboxypeptidase PM20D1